MKKSEIRARFHQAKIAKNRSIADKPSQKRGCSSCGRVTWKPEK